MIRKASINDIDNINILGKMLHENFDQVYDLKESLKEDITILLVNIENDQINAYLYAQNIIDHIDLLSIVVNPKNRNNNIGSQLLKYLINNYCYQDKPIILEVASNNLPALKLYEKFNFQIVGIRKNYYANEDAYLMKRGK